jgi:hypothetical protein
MEDLALDVGEAFGVLEPSHDHEYQQRRSRVAPGSGVTGATFGVRAFDRRSRSARPGTVGAVSSSLEHQEHMARPSDTAEPSGPPTVSIACTSCRKLVPVGGACPHCGHATGPLRAPEPADVTVVLPPAPARTAELDITQIPADAPPPPQATARPPQSPDTSRRVLAVAGAAAALVLVGAAAVAGLRSGLADGGSGSPAAGAAAAADAVPVDPSLVRASASSTQRADGAVTYAAANTLDGRPQTAWNSDGQGVGATLTYTFSSPVDLRSVTVLNGYQKVRRSSSGATVDLYALNERIRTLTVVTDAGRVPWSLRDDRTPQTLTHDFGRTRTVRLEVTAVYPSARYRDLALSDVAFGVAP